MNWMFKSTPSLTGAQLFSGSTDWHSHILPGVDDGFKTMEDSLAALAEFDALGVKSIWLTPHVMEDLPNGTKHLKDVFSRLEDAWKGKAELNLAAEYMLDPLFASRLEENDLLPLGKASRHLLVETSYFNPPREMDSLLSRIFAAGYFPVLAHPERYRYMTCDDYRRLHGMGVLFQIDILSAVGAYGEDARKKCERLLASGMSDLSGTDIHHLPAFLNYIGKSPRKRSVIDALSITAARGLN